MKFFLNYILCFIVCLSVASRIYAGERDRMPVSEYVQQERIIDLFHNSLGFSYLYENDSTNINVEELLDVLEEDGRYDLYFELERIVIKSSVLKGEVRLAIVRSDQMYSKAKVLKHKLGQALALNTIGEIYALTGKDQEAGEVYEEALRLLNAQDKCEVLVKILLIELTEYYFRVGHIDKAAGCIAQLNKYPMKNVSDSERAIRHIFNAYYLLYSGSQEEAHRYLEEVRHLESGLLPGIRQFFLIAQAVYLRKSGKLPEALSVYDRYFKLEGIKRNNALYLMVLKDKADLLIEMGRKEEAFVQYGVVYSYINATFDRNYPKEISQLSTSFQADQLTYQNERDRHMSMLFYTAGIIVSVLLLLVFSLLSWKKIFRLKQSKTRQEEMKQKADLAIKRKNLFLSNMSHEVRTPLNAIVGFSSLLAGDPKTDDDVQLEYCEIIKVNSRQLLKLINDILDFSDFEGDNIKFNIKAYDAVKICREVIETMFVSYRFQVELRFETLLPELVFETDDARLRQVLINLLVNATKFTKEGSVVLKLEYDGCDQQTALFSVTDTGCGIPFEKQKLIFERFEKLNDFVQGSGLGLSICQSIVKYMGGKLWVDAEYTQGTRFYFTHPLKYEPTLH